MTKITVCIQPPSLPPRCARSRIAPTITHTSVLRDFHHLPIHDYVSLSNFFKSIFFFYFFYIFFLVYVFQVLIWFCSWIFRSWRSSENVVFLFFFLVSDFQGDAIRADKSVTRRVESSTLHTRWPTRRKIVTITVKKIFFLASSAALDMRFDTNMMMALPPMESADR